MIKNILIIVVGLVIIGGLYAIVVPALPKQEAKGCTMEAMICPDGSAVGRTGPNCEFAACPAAKPIIYLCAGNKTISATFKINSVALAFSDGRTLELAKVMDGDEVKYVLESMPIEFWVHEDSAFLTENGVSTFTGCRNTDATFPEPSVTGSGTILGSTSLGPVCPVERDPPDPACADKAYVGKLEILQASNGKVAQAVTTEGDGTFSVQVPAGSYKVRSPLSQMLPRCSSDTVVVQAGARAPVAVTCDTGIR